MAIVHGTRRTRYRATYKTIFVLNYSFERPPLLPPPPSPGERLIELGKVDCGKDLAADQCPGENDLRVVRGDP